MVDKELLEAIRLLLDEKFAEYDQKMDSRFAEQDKSIDARFAEQEKRFDAKLEEKLEEKLEPIRTDLATFKDYVSAQFAQAQRERKQLQTQIYHEQRSQEFAHAELRAAIKATEAKTEQGQSELARMLADVTDFIPDVK